MSNYTVLDSGIREYKNFLTVQEAEELVAHLEANKGNKDLIDLTKVRDWPAIVTTINSRAIAEIADLAEGADLEPQTLKLWKHPIGASTKPNDYHHFSFVIHLNNEYEGGEFVMPSKNVSVKPEALSMFVFKAGDAYGVSTITEGDRYSMGGAVRLAGVV